MNQTLTPEIDIHGIADFEGIKRRFEAGFDGFVEDKMQVAARQALRAELGDTSIVDNSDFINKVARAIDEEALSEKRFIFISVNREYLESIQN